MAAGFSAQILSESRTLGLLSRYQPGGRGVGGLPHGTTRGLSARGWPSRSSSLTRRTRCRGYVVVVVEGIGEGIDEREVGLAGGRTGHGGVVAG